MLKRVSDSQGRRIGPGMRGPSAHQHGFRIDPKSDGDQRQYKNDDKGSHGPFVAPEYGGIPAP
jgi:hypothetical protein